MTLGEPIFFILTVSLLRGLVHVGLPAYGQSIYVFFSSGVFPFYLFMRLALRAAMVPYEAARRIPRATSFDYLIASIITETTIILVMGFLWFLLLWLIGLKDAVPVSLEDCAIPLFFLGMLGVGLGLINSAITRRLSLWPYFFGRFVHALALCSGVFFIVDLMPLFLRDWAVWIPTCHAIEWFRLGLYGNYPHSTMDREYLMWSSGITLLLGLAVYRATIRVKA